MTKAANDFSWLDEPAKETANPRIKASAKLPKELARAPSMGKKLLGKSRTWGCDGEFVYFRRKQANPATLERHNKFVESGEYKHVTTQDDLEIWQLQDGSAFKRFQMDLESLDYANVRRTAIIAACKRDFGLYVDAVLELAGRIKGKYHEAFAQTVYNDELTHIFRMIEMRNGPSPGEMNRELQAVRKRRRENVRSGLLLPNPKMIERL